MSTGGPGASSWTRRDRSPETGRVPGAGAADFATVAYSDCSRLMKGFPTRLAQA